MATDGPRSLAGGALVETRLCARLLGIKLLVVDGAIALYPAEPEGLPTVPGSLVDRRPSETLERREPAGHRLAETARRLETSARRLQALRSAG